VTAAAAGTKTQDLALDAPLAGAIAHVEFLETCRLDDDQVSVKWERRVFEAEMNSRVVQQ
jgi:hypothetical protein